ncbi:MAG: universal stress protein [Mycobacterium sp.]|nr:universal stress protein [Mycobacterium sp.]
MHDKKSRPVIVGIDGSKAALRAALWAAEEAAGRDTVLRLTHVVDPHRDIDAEYDRAYRILHRAWEAVQSHGPAVKLESDVLQGDPVEELAGASRRAQLVCVGFKGRNDSGRRMRGSTAALLARTAFSPVAIVRRRKTDSKARQRCVIAVLDESPGSHEVLQVAVGEALIRQAAVLALTPWVPERHDLDSAESGSVRNQLAQLLERAEDEDTDIALSTAPMPAELLEVLARRPKVEQLLVLDESRPDLVEDLVGPEARAALRKCNCSLLIIHSAPEDQR